MPQISKIEYSSKLAWSGEVLMVTDVEDEMSWWQVWNVGDRTFQKYRQPI